MPVPGGREKSNQNLTVPLGIFFGILLVLILYRYSISSLRHLGNSVQRRRTAGTAARKLHFGGLR